MEYTKELEAYEEHLLERELTGQTRQIYIRQAELFLGFLENRTVTKLEVLAYKDKLGRQGQKLSTVNLHIAAVNSYLRFIGRCDCTVKMQKLQGRESPDNIITAEEYRRLLAWARASGREKYYCIMRTLALTGIRISELSGCSVEALARGRYIVCNKGKSREVYLPEKLIAELSRYCERNHIHEGAIFLGCTGKPISRSAVYRMLARLAQELGMPGGRVHPHSFRHLFALTYMQQYSNLFELADLLGHSSLETTRIYAAASAEERRQRINEMEL